MGVVFVELISHLWDWRWITTALVFAVTYLVGRFYRKVSRYPRGPFPLPLVGNLLALHQVKSLHCKATEWSKSYGDVFTLWMSHSPMVVLNSQETIREAFLLRRHDFSGRFPTKMGAVLLQGDHDIIFENYNQCWKALRKVFLLAVRKYAVSDALGKLCADVVDTYADSLQHEPQLVDSKKPFFDILYTLIGVSFYGTKIDGDSKEIRRMEEIDHEILTLAPNGMPSDIASCLGIVYRRTENKIESLFREKTEICRQLFAKAETTYTPDKSDNFTHAMLAAREEAILEEKGDAEYLTKGNMIQLVRNTFAGATSTTAGELQWLFLRMAKEPRIQTKIQMEIADNIGSTPPVYGDRTKLPFTVACVLETLRCHPIAPLGLPHNTSTDTKVGELIIPKGTRIMYNAYSVNHDRNAWDDPQEFRPERFIDAATGTLRHDVKATLTFGMGPRTCPGEKLAHADMFYILVRLMQRLSCSAPGRPSDVNIHDAISKFMLMPVKQNIVLTRKN